MLNKNLNKLQILDCTLRDGGYYTNWDFSQDLVNTYFEQINKLPLDYIEIGYRSTIKQKYNGAFYYLPPYLLEECSEKCDKKLAIILNEKEIDLDDVEELLNPCKGLISMVRLAVAPENMERATQLAKKIKSLNFEIGFNVMYASKWNIDDLFIKQLKQINQIADYFYVVDSYGGLYPNDVENMILNIKEYLDIPIGFHGHNNLELALVNSLQALKSGAQIIDSTILGMGRGAGNLKTELILTILNKQRELKVDYDALNRLTNLFETLQSKYQWGTNLPFMISGSFSLPQDAVISKIRKRFQSLNAIVRESEIIGEQSRTLYINFPEFSPNQIFDKVMIIGGGVSTLKNSNAHIQFLKKNPNIALIFVSSKNVNTLAEIENSSFHCLVGNEAERFMRISQSHEIDNKIFIISNVSTFVPSRLEKFTFHIPSTNFEVPYNGSATAMALDIGSALKMNTIYLSGFDGYQSDIQPEEIELFQENQILFDKIKEKGIAIFSVTPTLYEVEMKSIYSLF